MAPEGGGGLHFLTNENVKFQNFLKARKGPPLPRPPLKFRFLLLIEDFFKRKFKYLNII